jgi:hypothetical protein
MWMKWGIVLLGFFFAHISMVQAATLEFSPADGTYKVGDTISIKLMVDGGTTDVNAAEATVSYDKTHLSAKSVSKDGSVFTLWTQEPTISSSKGTISLGGGTPSAFSGKKTIATLVLKAEKEGTATLSISDGSVVSPSQGFADVLSEKKTASFTIGAGSTTKPPETEPKTETRPTLGPTPNAPELLSEEFSDPDKWYATTTATFSWQLSYDVDSIKMLVDREEISVPTVLYDPPVSSKTLTDLEEGESYFHIMFHNRAGWGVPTHRKLRIDVTPPNTFTLVVSQDDLYSQDISFRFEARDELSGIARYELLVDGVVQEEITPKDILNGQYALNVPEAGEHIFSVIAYDAAGNSVEAKNTFTVAEALVRTVAPTDDEEPQKEGIQWAYWIALVLVAIVAFLVGALVYERKAVRVEKERIKQEADEARKKLEGIFAVLRDEIEEQVIQLATKPNMTESERGILEKLKEALEISEELLDKEIEDVRKLLL